MCAIFKMAPGCNLELEWSAREPGWTWPFGPSNCMSYKTVENCRPLEVLWPNCYLTAFRQIGKDFLLFIIDGGGYLWLLLRVIRDMHNYIQNTNNNDSNKSHVCCLLGVRHPWVLCLHLL